MQHKESCRTIKILQLIALTITSQILAIAAVAQDLSIDLSQTTVYTRANAEAVVEASALEVWIEEVEKRTGRTLTVSDKKFESDRPFLIISNSTPSSELQTNPLGGLEDQLADLPAEGFVIDTKVEESGGRTDAIIRIVGADGRGLLFGVGYLLRKIGIRYQDVILPEPIHTAQSPAYPLRGHQLGYRDRANSWDAWTPEQFDQYIRELTFFGTNAIENIPFQDDAPGYHMKVDRRDMNRIMSEICQKYDLEYWVWTPAEFDLSDNQLRAELLERHKQLYEDCPRLSAVFFPGGDPGHNPPELVLPFLEDLAELLAKHHPDAKVWLSMQGFSKEHVEDVYQYIDAEMPDWLGGLVAGPGSPLIPETRVRLNKKYKLRHYPDITHTVRCQYPTPWWDPAFALTLGREPINPQPIYYSQIHNTLAPYTDGFITYSDGVHDDVNKVVWSALGWNPETPILEILKDYVRIYIRSNGDEADWDAGWILELERNWEGSLIDNYAPMQQVLLFLQDESPSKASNWRLQMLCARAFYDAGTRERLRDETQREWSANSILLTCQTIGAEKAMTLANRELDTSILTDSGRFAMMLLVEAMEYCDLLFKSISLQTSVPEHHASGPERGAILDFIDHPLNNRWWLEDEFEKVKQMKTEEEKVARLLEIANWENPGPGGFYDDIGNVAKSPHVIRGETPSTDPEMRRSPNPDLMWWDGGKSRQRQSWITYMMWPLGMRYMGLDPDAEYVIRTTGYGQCLLRIDGERVNPTIDGRGIGEIKEFPVPQKHLADMELHLTFDEPTDEGHLNWRQQSRLTEVWLIKKTSK